MRKRLSRLRESFDVLNYYPLIDTNGSISRFAEVECSGQIDLERDKLCSSRIRIKAELNFASFIKASIDWIKEKTTPPKIETGSSGDYAQIGSSGYSAKIGSSGYSAQIGSSGYSAQIGSSGYSAKINSEGEHAIICCAGHGSIAKAKIGSWITLSEWIYSAEKMCYIPKCVKTEYVDGTKIKADTWYKLVDGEFTEL